MSEMWNPEHVERVPVWTKQPARTFSARGHGAGPYFSAWAGEPATVADPMPVVEPEMLLAESYAQGFAEGRRAVEAELAAERAALATLAASIDTLKPEAPTALAAVLAETVKRLVAQVVGEVEMDEAMLAERAHAVAALIADGGEAGRIRLHPADAERLADAGLDHELVPDPSLPQGTLIAETGCGWIEDGKAVRLDKVRAALDRMGAPR